MSAPEIPRGAPDQPSAASGRTDAERESRCGAGPAPTTRPATTPLPAALAALGRRPRIGLYGGSFDPVHAGHLHAARAALAAFDLDLVVFMPAARSPHKLSRELASGAHRLAMLALAIAGEPRFVPSDLELARGGPSFTIDTVRELPRALGRADIDLHLILGSDTLPDFPRWREARELAELVQPVVVHREGDPELRLADLERALGPEIRRRFERGYLRLPAVEVSSSELRARPPALASGPGGTEGEPIPPAVLAYIHRHGLYGVPAADGPRA